MRVVDGIRTKDPVRLILNAAPDEPPRVGLHLRAIGTSITPQARLPIEGEITDDYGVAKLDLVYSVNGEGEKTLPLSQGVRALRDISAGHTFMLEDMKLEPGDVVSYYARAVDNNTTVKGAQSASTDIFFMTVRPYDQDYRQQQGGGGGCRMYGEAGSSAVCAGICAPGRPASQGWAN